jgi:hypothetical protein
MEASMEASTNTSDVRKLKHNKNIY